MHLSRVIGGAVLAVMLSACSAMSALDTVTSAISPNKPEITAQVGKTNTKQGIGVTASNEQTTNTDVGATSGHDNTVANAVQTAAPSDEGVVVKDTTGGTVNASKQGQQVTAGPVTAKNVTIVTGSTTPLLWSFAISFGILTGLIMWFVPRPRLKTKQDDGTNQTTGDSGTPAA